MKKSISNIINWCIKHNYNNFTIQECVNNNQRVELLFTDYNIYSAVLSTVRKLKNVHIETWRAFSQIFEGSIYICDNDTWNNITEYNDNKSKLIDIFWYAKHDGYSSADAQKMQLQYAIDNNLIDIYNKIYA